MKGYGLVCALFLAGYGLFGVPGSAQSEMARYNVDPDHSTTNFASRIW